MLNQIYDNSLAVIVLSVLLSTFIVFMARRKRIRSFKDILYLGPVFVLSFSMFFLYTVLYGAVKFRENKRVFSKSTWNSDVEKRVEIVDDLIKRSLLLSKTEKEVVDLLGKPVRIYKTASATRLAYYLGFRREVFAIDPEFLVVDIQKGQTIGCMLKLGVPYTQ